MIQRGDVFRTQLSLPNRKTGNGTTTLTKYVVALQGGPAFDTATDIAIAVASTHRRSTVRPFEVLVGVVDGFAHDTVIDCRWPYTVPKSVLPAAPEFRLTSSVMRSVSVALVVGLQMN